jgi:hypothetical protein
MKKNLLTGFTGLFLILVVSIAANGQIASTDNMQPSGDIISSAKPNSDPIASSKVHQKAVKDLAKSFKSLTGEKWYVLRDGFVAMFSLNGSDHQVCYDKKGNWLLTIRSYGEANLDHDVRHIVKSTYYDYEINLVQEVETPTAPKIYIVQLVSKTEIVSVKVIDGEMQVLQKFIKSE